SAKTDYIKSHGLGGAMMWSLENLDPGTTLLNDIVNGLSGSGPSPSPSPSSSPTPSPTGGTSTTYQAESSANTLAGGATVISCSTCSGGKRVGHIGKGGTLTFNKVNAATAGTYAVKVYYSNGSS